jgi:hypothetical protein
MLTLNQVERALTLVATGTLTVEIHHAAKGKAVTIPKMKNLGSGKDSMQPVGFNDAAWGVATQHYATNAGRLPDAKFKAIFDEAREFMKTVRGRKNTEGTEAVKTKNDNDTRVMVLSDVE